MITKEQKEELFIENKYYIDYIVYNFLSEHPSYYYMKEDLQAECYLKFLELIDKFDGEKSKFTTYLKSQLTGWLYVWVRTETITSIKAKRFKDEHKDKEEDYTMDDQFLDLLDNADLTDKQRYCITEKFENDKTTGEIGKELGVTRQAVDKILNRAFVKISKTYDT